MFFANNIIPRRTGDQYSKTKVNMIILSKIAKNMFEMN